MYISIKSRQKMISRCTLSGHLIGDGHWSRRVMNNGICMAWLSIDDDKTSRMWVETSIHSATMIRETRQEYDVYYILIRKRVVSFGITVGEMREHRPV